MYGDIISPIMQRQVLGEAWQYLQNLPKINKRCFVLLCENKPIMHLEKFTITCLLSISETKY